MDGYFCLDQLARLKFRLFHMLLEIWKCLGIFQKISVFWISCYVAFHIISPNFLGTYWCGSLLFPHYLLIEFQALCYSADNVDVSSMSATYFLCQLPTILSILSLLPIMGTVPLVKSPMLFTVFFKRSSSARLALGWAMGGVNGSKSFKVCCHWRRSFPCWCPRAISSWESGKFLQKERVQARLQEVSWGFREMCVVNCCREVRQRPRVELFLPSCSGWWRRSCLQATLWHVAWWTTTEMMGEGRRDGGLRVGLSVVLWKSRGNWSGLQLGAALTKGMSWLFAPSV